MESLRQDGNTPRDEHAFIFFKKYKYTINMSLFRIWLEIWGRKEKKKILIRRKKKKGSVFLFSWLEI